MTLPNADKVSRLLKNAIICFLFLYSISSFSQNTPSEKILLKQAKELIAKKEYKKAENILSENYTKYSENVNINWLYAHVLLINGDEKLAQKKFKKAYTLAPENEYLEMDYARFLYNTGKIYKAENIISNFTDENSTNAEFLLMQANIEFWKGDLKASQKIIDRIQEIYPNTDITNDLSAQIKDVTSIYVKANLEYQEDSQPLNYFAHHLAISQYFSNLLNPKLEISNFYFSPERELALVVELSNQFRFERLKLSAELSVGVYKNLAGTADWIGGLSFTKDIVKNLSLNFGYKKSELLGTIASTKFNLTQQDAFANLNYNNKWIIFNGGYNHKFFDDGNFITSIAGYLVSQPIKIRNFNFQLGYGFSYTDAEDILFFYDNQGLGIYDPYFTPKEQVIHSGLFIANYKPTEKLTLSGKLNYGIEANVQNPFPVEVLPGVFEIGGFYNQPFDAMDIDASINYAFSNSFSIKASYIYQETFFYDRDNFNLELNYKF